MSKKLIISLILAGLALLFVIQNVSVVEIRFLFWSFAMSRSLFMFFLFLIGIIVGWLLHSYYVHYMSRKKG
ncbi:MAG: LapA family protein [Desulfobulbaceae bacterium]|nr:LapA family protein [Desulfobulbaceae bacterium]